VPADVGGTHVGGSLRVRRFSEQVWGDSDERGHCLTRAIRVALAEDGTTYRLKLVGHHVLCAGATGAGKGSVISAIVSGLSEEALAGRVNLWVIDPKGGVELAPGRHLYSRFAYGDAKSDVS
jgi:hypothetical protein